MKLCQDCAYGNKQVSGTLVSGYRYDTRTNGPRKFEGVLCEEHINNTLFHTREDLMLELEKRFKTMVDKVTISGTKE